jgi:polar amino acid transport system substrate-binding protein
MKKISLILTAFYFSSLVTTNSVFAKSLLDEIKQRGKIKIGSTLKYPPQMYRDSNGEPAGYDVELMKMLANDMKVELEVVDMDFPGLIPALLAGKVDMLSVGLVNTPERALTLEFTDGYVPYRQVVVVPKNSSAKNIGDLNVKGMKITALMGSTAENIAKMKFPNAEITGFNQQEAMMEVTSGRADGHVAEEYLAMPLVAKYPNKLKI